MTELIDEFGARHIPSSYEGVEFPTDDVSVSGGNDFVLHKYYLGDGGDHEFAGQNPNEGKLRALMLNDIGAGTLWPDRYLQLMRKFASNPIGTLMHPIYGRLRVAIVSWEVISNTRNRSGYVIEITWRQDRGTQTGSLRGYRRPHRNADAAAATSNAAAAADAYQTTLGGPDGYQMLAPIVDAALTTIENPNAGYQSIVSAYREVISSALQNIAIAENDYIYTDMLFALEETISMFSEIYKNYIPAAQVQSYYIVGRDMSVHELSYELYGSVDGIDLIYKSNNIVGNSLKSGDKIIVPRIQ